MTNFNMATSNTAPRPTYVDIDLSVAREDQELNIVGATFIFAMLEAFDGPTTKSSTKSVGELFIKQNGNDAAPLYLTAGRSFYMQPTIKLFLTNEAQPGAMIRLLFTADGSQIIPFSTDIQATGLEALLQNHNVLAAPLNIIGDNAASGSLISGTITLLTPGANTDGAIIRTACVSPGSATSVGLCVKSSAPSSIQDQAIMMSSVDQNVNLFDQIKVDAGDGIYLVANGGGSYSVTWDVL